MTTFLPSTACPWLAAVLAMAVTLSTLGQEAAPAAPTPEAVAAAAAAAVAAAQDAEEGSEEEGPAEDEAAAASTNGAPSVSVPGSTNAPTNSVSWTNAPARRTSRRSSRRPERSGISDWRPSSRSSSSSGKAAATNGPASTDYAYFQPVNDRNIFNPARVPNRPDRPRPTETRRTPKVESLSLVGTLRYEKGIFAFFDGTSSEFRKALKEGDAVGGHRILSVTDSTVRLVVQDRAVDLKVGNQLRREDEGEWTLASGVTLGASSASGGSGSTSSSSSSGNTASASANSSNASSSSSSGSSGGGAEEILRRLRERRAQETKQ